MRAEINTQKGWTEAIIDNDCESSKFYLIENILRNNYGLSFATKIEALDSIYWDFEFEGSQFTLHYNIYLGVLIFPKSLTKATLAENDKVVIVSDKIMRSLSEHDWQPYNDGKSINGLGSEGGRIIEDYSNIEGARITLEQNFDDIPYSITFGIYGLMFHTHHVENLDEAQAYIATIKLKINKVLEHHDISEDKRGDIWLNKLNMMIEKLVE